MDQTPSEPLLPVESAPPLKSRFPILLGVIAVLGIAAGFAVMRMRHPEIPPSEDSAAPAMPTPEKPSGKPSDPTPGKPVAADPRSRLDEKEAKELYDAAETFERADSGEFEKRIARWREVVAKYPTTSWAVRADEKLRAANTSLQKFLDREFEGARKDAQSLAAGGFYADAIEALQAYAASQTRDLLKRRAEAEIASISNACRIAFNEASTKARELAAKGDYASASATFENLAKSGTSEVAERCRKALAQLQTAGHAAAEYEQLRKADTARRAFREETGPRLLASVRARQYEEALGALSAAAANPAYAGFKDEIVAERASVADASSFWDAFLKALKARSGQDTTLLLADGRRVTGKITRILPDRVSLEAGEGTVEAPLDKLHADLLVGWTIGRGLPAEDGVSYVKAALFFFCEGRDDLARLYLATARELNGPADAAEKVFREGFLRAAAAAKK